MTLRAPFNQRLSKSADLRAHGCTLFSAAWLRRWASEGDEAPSSQAAIDRAVNALQRASGATLARFRARGTTLDEAERAFEAGRFAGRTKPAMRKFHGGSIRDDLLPELRDGKVALVAVNYGVLQDAGKGVGTFRGGHAVVVGNADVNSTVDFVDPLRRATIRIDIDLLETAMERFGSRPWLNGRGEFATVAKSPTFLEVAQAQRDKARKQRDEAREAIKDLKEQAVVLVQDNKDLEARVVSLADDLALCMSRPPAPTDPAAIAAARAQGIADAAAAARAVT